MILLLALLLNCGAAVDTGDIPSGGTFSLTFGGGEYGIAKSADGGSTWTPIASIAQNLHRHCVDFGVVSGTYTAGMQLKFQTLSSDYAKNNGWFCPGEDRCSGTCTFDTRQNCFNWDYACIFVYDFLVDGVRMDLSSWTAMEAQGWETGCRRGMEEKDTCNRHGGHLVRTCDRVPGSEVGIPGFRQNGSWTFYKFTFPGDYNLRNQEKCTLPDVLNGVWSGKDAGDLVESGATVDIVPEDSNTHTCSVTSVSCTDGVLDVVPECLPICTLPYIAGGEWSESGPIESGTKVYFMSDDTHTCTNTGMEIVCNDDGSLSYNDNDSLSWEDPDCELKCTLDDVPNGVWQGKDVGDSVESGETVEIVPANSSTHECSMTNVMCTDGVPESVECTPKGCTLTEIIGGDWIDQNEVVVTEVSSGDTVTFTPESDTCEKARTWTLQCFEGSLSLDMDSKFAPGLGNDFTMSRGDCEIDDNGCFTSPNYPNKYGNHEHCIAEISTSGYYDLVDWNLETYYDFLTIGGVRKLSTFESQYYSGGTSITFTSDYSVVMRGFKLCRTDCP